MLAAIGCLTLAVLVAAAPLPAEPVGNVIEQLGHADAARRAEARRYLQRVGPPVLEQVRKAAAVHESATVRAAAADVAACIERGEVFSFGGGSGYWFNRVAFTDDPRYALVTGGGLFVMDLARGKEVRRELEVQ